MMIDDLFGSFFSSFILLIWVGVFLRYVIVYVLFVFECFVDWFMIFVVGKIRCCNELGFRIIFY